LPWGIPKLMVFSITYMTPCLIITPSLWKKLHHKIISHLFSRVADIRGCKVNMCASKKTLNKIWWKVSRECIKLPKFTKYQKTQKRSSWDSKQCSKQQKMESANKNNSSLAKFSPPLSMSLIFSIFYSGRMKFYNLDKSRRSIGITENIRNFMHH
jgi:hypothetical protein